MSRNRIQGIVNHWSASPKTWTVKDIRQSHKARGWRDVGYHRVIEYPLNDQTEWWELVKQGRALDMDLYLDDMEIGAHTLGGFNRNWIGICVIGNIDYKAHELQIIALYKTNQILCERFGLNIKKDVKMHRELNPTLCPGSEIAYHVERIREGLPVKEGEIIS